jgi:hypothetical protein
MLTQLNHWVMIAGTAIDALLLLRILQLRLQRTYLFITLAALLTLFFDVVSLWVGPESRANVNLFIYSRFLYFFVLPAAAYDVWEEAKPQIVAVRKFATQRLIASLTLTSIFGLIIASVASSEEESVIGEFAVVVWAAASTASLAFLWSVHRLARAQKTVLPGNTSVWLSYYRLSLAGEVVWCFLLIAVRLFQPVVIDTLNLCLNLYEIGITLWCIWRLRAVATDVPSAPERASS